MKKILFIKWFVIFFGFTSTAFSQDLLQKLDAKSSSIQSWQADFEQITTVATIDETLNKSGQIQAQKPKKFRISYNTEPQKNYIYNGQSLWLHQVQSQSVIHYKNPEDFISNEALAFLGGTEKLSTLFQNVEPNDFDKKFSFQNKNLLTLILKPLVNQSTIDFLVLGLDNKLNTQEAFLWTQSGNTTHYIFKNSKQNLSLDSGLFSWTKQNNIEEIEQ